MTTQLTQCLTDWNCLIEFQANWDATNNCGQVKEFVDGDVKIRLHSKGNTYFIEERIGKEMYPTIYKVKCDLKPVQEVTDSEYEQWLKAKQ